MNVLDQRAARLAAAAKRDAEVPVVELLRFQVGSERYAIETAYLHGVLHIDKVGFVPSAPRHVTGVINFQGEVLPLFDVERLWSAPASSGGARKAIVLGREALEFAIIVDDANEIVDLPAADISRRQSQDQFVLCVLPDGSAVLDAAAMLDSAQFVYGDEQHERKA
ncbi:MAG: chemotaxis protein CheW [Vulcanimicrobiaceae bacterium]